MKIAVVSAEKQFEIDRIREECIKRNHEFKFFFPDMIQPSFSSAKYFDVVLFRALKGFSVEGRAAALSFFSSGSKIVDEKLVSMLGRNKFTNYFCFIKAGLNIPKTFFLNPKTIYSLPFSDSDWIVLKDLEGKRGEGVYKIRFSDLHSFLPSIKGKFFLVQEFIRFEKELRVLVVGNNALGAFEKQSTDWKKNIAQNAFSVPFDLTKEISDIAVKASNSAGLEIAGVDLGLFNGKWFVLETNRSPLFRAFEETTGINAAGKIVDYLEKKAGKK